MFQISGKRPRMISDYMFVRKKTNQEGKEDICKLCIL
jgi:hypothetical protein